MANSTVELTIQHMWNSNAVYRCNLVVNTDTDQTVCEACSPLACGALAEDLVYVEIKGLDACAISIGLLNSEITVCSGPIKVPLCHIAGAMVHWIMADNDAHSLLCETLLNGPNKHKNTADVTDTRDDVERMIDMLNTTTIGEHKEKRTRCWMCNAKLHAAEYILHADGCTSKELPVVSNPWSGKKYEGLVKMRDNSPLCCDAMQTALDTLCESTLHGDMNPAKSVDEEIVDPDAPSAADVLFQRPSNV